MCFAMTLVPGTLQLHGSLVMGCLSMWNNLEFALCVNQDEILITLGPVRVLMSSVPKVMSCLTLVLGAVVLCENAMASAPVGGDSGDSLELNRPFSCP